MLSDRQKGFSLLEVLVAFAILAMTLGVLLQVFSAGLRNAAVSEDYTYAILHAESLLAVLGAEEPLNVGVTEGELDDKFSWRNTVTLYTEDDLPVDESSQAIPYRVQVEVFWQGGKEMRSVMLETLRLAPPADEQG